MWSWDQQFSRAQQEHFRNPLYAVATLIRSPVSEREMTSEGRWQFVRGWRCVEEKVTSGPDCTAAVQEPSGFSVWNACQQTQIDHTGKLVPAKLKRCKTGEKQRRKKLKASLYSTFKKFPAVEKLSVFMAIFGTRNVQ